MNPGGGNKNFTVKPLGKCDKMLLGYLCWTSIPSGRVEVGERGEGVAIQASMFSMFTRPLSFVTNLFRFSLANVSERCLACLLVFRF